MFLSECGWKDENDRKIYKMQSQVSVFLCYNRQISCTANVEITVENGKGGGHGQPINLAGSV